MLCARLRFCLSVERVLQQSVSRAPEEPVSFGWGDWILRPAVRGGFRTRSNLFSRLTLKSELVNRPRDEAKGNKDRQLAQGSNDPRLLVSPYVIGR